MSGEVLLRDCISTPDPKNIPISEGDILNIRTEVNNIPNAPTVFVVRTNRNFNTDKTKDDFYLFDRVGSVVNNVLNKFF